MLSLGMTPCRKHQKVERQDTDGLLHCNDAMTSALVAELVSLFIPYADGVLVLKSIISYLCKHNFYIIWL